jgi:hypothetical protein
MPPFREHLPMKFRPIHCLAGLPLLMCAGANANEQCFSGIDLNVPATTEGLYVNLVNGLSGQSEGAVPGFDIDIYASANSVPSDQLKFYWGAASTGGAGVASIGDTYAVLNAGEVIGPASLFTRAAFAGDTSGWQAGVAAYLGLRFRNESNGVIQYGWMRLSTSAPLGFPAIIEGWCYEDSGAAITIPASAEPAVFANGFEP